MRDQGFIFKAAAAMLLLQKKHVVFGGKAKLKTRYPQHLNIICIIAK